MSAGTRSEGGSPASTRNSANFLGASSTQSHTGSPNRDMIYLHRPQNKRGQGTLQTSLTPPPSKRELTRW